MLREESDKFIDKLRPVCVIEGMVGAGEARLRAVRQTPVRVMTSGSLRESRALWTVHSSRPCAVVSHHGPYKRRFCSFCTPRPSSFHSLSYSHIVRSISTIRPPKSQSPQPCSSLASTPLPACLLRSRMTVCAPSVPRRDIFLYSSTYSPHRPCDMLYNAQAEPNRTLAACVHADSRSQSRH